MSVCTQISVGRQGLRSQKKCRWYQFTLRGLLLFVLLSSLACSWLAVRMERARKQEMAVKTLESFGVAAAYETRANTPAPLKSLLGRDVFEDMVAINLVSPSDAELACLDELPGLRRLCMRGQRVPVTDSALAHLRSLTKLEELSLPCTGITDEGLSNLRGLVRMRRLSLNSTCVGDAGVAHLSSLRRLEWLYLSSTRITDAGLRHLATLSQLRSLGVSNTRVTDAGLRHLAALRRLESLDVSDTEVTPEGVQELRTALPGLKDVAFARHPRE